MNFKQVLGFTLIYNYFGNCAAAEWRILFDYVIVFIFIEYEWCTFTFFVIANSTAHTVIYTYLRKHIGMHICMYMYIYIHELYIHINTHLYRAPSIPKKKTLNTSFSFPLYLKFRYSKWLIVLVHMYIHTDEYTYMYAYGSLWL